MSVTKNKKNKLDKLVFGFKWSDFEVSTVDCMGNVEFNLCEDGDNNSFTLNQTDLKMLIEHLQKQVL